MLLSTLSGGLFMMHVSSLMVSCTHWLWTSLVSILFPVYIMSIAYWRAQASSADHWHRLSRWCSRVSWYSVALLVVSMCPYSLALLPSLCSLYSIELLCIMGISMVCAPVSHIAYWRLAESSWEASGGLVWTSFWGAYWGTSLGSFLGNALGTYKLSG